MKRILFIALVLLSTLGYSQSYRKVTVREELVLTDSSVTNITTGDTLATKEWTIQNAAILTGNATEIFYNSNGILGASPRFTYDPADSTLTVDSLQLANGETISWNVDEYTIDIKTGLGPVLQVGQEIYILIYNNTGSQIDNSTVLRPVAAADVGGVLFPTVEKAISNVFSGVEGTLMVSTMDIPNGTVGIATRFGRVRDANTASFTPGDALWVSAVDSGVLVNVRPEFPNYDISMGGVLSSGAGTGEIFVSITRDIFNTFNNFWNGVFRETFDFLVTEAGGVITGTLTPANGHPDMTMIFSDGFSMLDTDPGATIVLTAGTDVNPQTNYVYVLESTKVLTISTSDWPTTEHIKVAQVSLQSATSTGNNGALRNQNWNDHIQSTTTNQGHLSHITEKLRQFEAQWHSGAEGSSTVDAVPTPDDVWISTTSGEVYQLHKQSFKAFDTETGDSIYIVNHPTTAYTIVNNLNGQLLDAAGATLNNTSFSFVLWGVANKSGDSSHVMINLPSGSYAFASPANAVSDALNYSVYDIPTDFQGVGFLIARFTYTYKNDAWVLYDTENLRGRIPNSTAGGGAGGTGVTTFLGLTDTESSYTAYEFQVANAGATALESPSGLTYNDSLNVSGNIIADTIKANGYIGIGVSHPLSALHINTGTAITDGIMFGANGNTGIYQGATNQLFAATAGVARWAFLSSYMGSVNGRAALKDDLATATNPNIVPSVSADDNTGIGSNAADQLSIIAGGKEIARASENVTEQLIINPIGDLTGTAAAPSLAFGDGNTGFREFTDNRIEVSINGTDLWTMSGFAFGGRHSTYPQFLPENPTATNPNIIVKSSQLTTGIGQAGANQLSLIANSIEAMRLTEDSVLMDSSVHIGQDLIVDGNVGIGTSIPDELLHILSSTNSSVLEVQSTFTGGDSRINLYADNTGLSQLRFGDQDDVNIGLITYDHSDNSMALRTNNATEVFINSSGDVGINDVTPTFKLDVNGTGRFTGDLTVDGSILGTLRCDTAHVSYTNVAQTTIVTLPDDAIISNIGLLVSTLFDAGTLNQFDVGITGEGDRYIDDAIITATSFGMINTSTLSSQVDFPDRMAGSTNITFTYTPTGGVPTQGEATVYIYYTIF